jgi:hypothetical protein
MTAQSNDRLRRSAGGELDPNARVVLALRNGLGDLDEETPRYEEPRGARPRGTVHRP